MTPELVCAPAALTITVFTRTGRIGSVEPVWTPDGSLAGAACATRVGAGLAWALDGKKWTGVLVALATANRRSGLPSLLSPSTFSVLAAGFPTGSASAAASLRSGVASGGGDASATIGAVRLIDACAIFSLIKSRIRASRLPALLPPITTATT